MFVSTTSTDRRSRRTDDDTEFLARVQRFAAAYLTAQRDLAKVLVELAGRGGHLLAASGSIRDYARVHLGIPGRDVAQLLDLGSALDVPAAHVQGAERPDGSPAEDGTAEDDVPLVEDRIVAGEMSTQNAALIGGLYRRLGDVSAEERAEWTAYAEDDSTWKLRQRIRKRIEEAEQREPTVPVSLRVTESAREDFHRARELASRKARKWLTEGQTFALVVRRFLDVEDERLVGDKLRRVPDTRERPKSRYVPAKVKREVRRRARDRCEVPGCSNGAFLELMHVTRAHRDGGSREIDNLALGCSTHHFLLDAGVIRFGGWRDGRPVFLDRRGEEIREGPGGRGRERSGTDGGHAAPAGGSPGSPAARAEPEEPRGEGATERDRRDAETVVLDTHANSEVPSSSDPTRDASQPSLETTVGPARDAPDARGRDRTDEAGHRDDTSPPSANRASDRDAWPRDDEPGTGQVAERPPPWRAGPTTRAYIDFEGWRFGWVRRAALVRLPGMRSACARTSRDRRRPDCTRAARTKPAGRSADTARRRDGSTLARPGPGPARRPTPLCRGPRGRHRERCRHDKQARTDGAGRFGGRVPAVGGLLASRDALEAFHVRKERCATYLREPRRGARLAVHEVLCDDEVPALLELAQMGAQVSARESQSVHQLGERRRATREQRGDDPESCLG